MESIKVLVQFDDNKVKPIAFRRNGRLYKIAKVNLVHSFKEGDRRIFNFHVSDNANSYNLRFESDILKWFLEE